MTNLYGIKGIRIKEFEGYGDCGVNSFLSDHDGDIINIFSNGTSTGTTKIIVVYKAF